MLTRHSEKENKKDSFTLYLLAFIFIFVAMNKWVFYASGLLFTIFLATITFNTVGNNNITVEPDSIQQNIKYMSPKNQEITKDFLQTVREINNKAQVYRDSH